MQPEIVEILKGIKHYDEVVEMYMRLTGKFDNMEPDSFLNEKIFPFEVETMVDNFSQSWETGIRKLREKKPGVWEVTEEWHQVEQYPDAQKAALGHVKWMIWAAENPEAGLPPDIRKDWHTIAEVFT